MLVDILLGDGAPASNAEVRARWRTPTLTSATGDKYIRFEGSTGSAGTLRLCGIPAGSRVEMTARTDTLQSEITDAFEIPFRTPLFARHIIIPTTLPAYRTRLIGIYDESTGEPVSDVAIVDLETASPAR